MNTIDPFALIERELAAGKNKIVIPKGVYRLEDCGRKFFPLKDLKNVEIDFSGSDLIGLARWGFFLLERRLCFPAQASIWSVIPICLIQNMTAFISCTWAGS